MKIILAALALFAAVTCCAAQQQQRQMSSFEQALNDRLREEITAAVQYRAALIETARELTQARARIKELEDKYEPKEKVK